MTHSISAYYETLKNCNNLPLCSVSRFIYCYAECCYAECRVAVVTSTKEHNVIVTGDFTNKILPMQTLLYTSKIS